MAKVKFSDRKDIPPSTPEDELNQLLICDILSTIKNTKLINCNHTKITSRCLSLSPMTE